MAKKVQTVLIFSALILSSLSFLLGPCGPQGKLLSSALSNVSYGPSDERMPEPKDVVHITPVDFFSGELKRLKSHLDFESAVCFKIKTEGQVTCVPEVEVWCDGERVDFAKYGVNTDTRSDEISFTLRRIVNAKSDKVQYYATFGGIRSFGRMLDEPTPRKHLNVAFGPVSVEQEFQLKRGDSVVVWAKGGGDGLDLAKRDEVQNELKKLPWVMIVRLVAR